MVGGLPWAPHPTQRVLRGRCAETPSSANNPRPLTRGRRLGLPGEWPDPIVTLRNCSGTQPPSVNPPTVAGCPLTDVG